MKKHLTNSLFYVGLILFIVGIGILFTRQFKPDFLGSISDRIVDFLWPIGLMIYSFSQIFSNKKKEETS